MRGDEVVRRGDPGLPGKNLFGQYAVNLLIGIEAGILENDTAEIQVKGAYGRRHFRGKGPRRYALSDRLSEAERTLRVGPAAALDSRRSKGRAAW